MIGALQWSSVVAIAITAVSVLVIAALAWAAASLRRSARELQELAGELSVHASLILAEVESAWESAQGELDRVDDLVGSAEAISATVGSASRIAQAALAGPLIKAMAFGAGTARAGRRIRGAPARGRRRW
ncbi:MAG: hypothetical protein ACRDYY_16060 [Acidimicrobiales bacterium]